MTIARVYTDSNAISLILVNYNSDLFNLFTPIFLSPHTYCTKISPGIQYIATFIGVSYIYIDPHCENVLFDAELCVNISCINIDIQLENCLYWVYISVHLL